MHARRACIDCSFFKMVCVVHTSFKEKYILYVKYSTILVLSPPLFWVDPLGQEKKNLLGATKQCEPTLLFLIFY